MGQKIWNIEPTPEEEARARRSRKTVVKRVVSHAPVLIAVLLVVSVTAMLSMELRARTPDDDVVGVFHFRHVRQYLQKLGSEGRTRQHPRHHGPAPEITGGVG